MNTNTQKSTLGKYGELRRRYLAEHRPDIFHRYAEQGVLEKHLRLTDEEMHRLVNAFVREKAEKEDITETLKRVDPLEWTRRMNSLKAQAEEIFLFQMVYAEEYPQPEEEPF